MLLAGEEQSKPSELINAVLGCESSSFPSSFVLSIAVDTAASRPEHHNYELKVSSQISVIA
jgi:hypothetical protein